MTTSRPASTQGHAVVAASFMALLAAPLSLSLPTLGLFILPVSQAFGWDRATFSLGPSAGAFAGALAAPFLGALADRWGARPILAVGAGFYALGVASLGLMQGSVALYLCLSILLYTAGQVQTSAIYSRVISSWFDRSRGMMIAIATSGLAIGGMLFPFVAKHLMAELGWRGTYFALGAMIAVLTLPPILLRVRERPSSAGMSAGDQAHGPSLTLRQATRTTTFWAILGVFFMAPFAMTGLAANLVPMLTGRGIDLTDAVLAVSSIAISQAAGRVVSGVLLDKVGVPQISLVWFAGAGVGLASLHFAHSPLVAICAAALIGLAWGAEGEICGYYVGRYFGLQHFARIAGTLFMALGTASAASIFLVGWLVDKTGGYGMAVSIAVGAMTVACSLLLSLKPYTFPPQDD